MYIYPNWIELNWNVDPKLDVLSCMLTPLLCKSPLSSESDTITFNDPELLFWNWETLFWLLILDYDPKLDVLSCMLTPLLCKSPLSSESDKITFNDPELLFLNGETLFWLLILDYDKICTVYTKFEFTSKRSIISRRQSCQVTIPWFTLFSFFLSF